VAEEKRRHPRRPLHPPIAFKTDTGARVDAICGDISIGGAFIQTENAAPFGAELTVFMYLPELNGEMQVRATVRWARRAAWACSSA
jgi:hypothetical protein